MTIMAGLWVELEAIIAFAFGLGYASLMGQRMVPIFRPILLLVQIPHLINLERSLVIELAVAHFEPAGVGFNYGIVKGPGGLRDSSHLLQESTTAAVCVIVAWLVFWTVLGAWRPGTREVMVAPTPSPPRAMKSLSSPSSPPSFPWTCRAARVANAHSCSRL
jgi:hypothetical protein